MSNMTLSGCALKTGTVCSKPTQACNLSTKRCAKPKKQDRIITIGENAYIDNKTGLEKALRAHLKGKTKTKVRSRSNSRSRSVSSSYSDDIGHKSNKRQRKVSQKCWEASEAPRIDKVCELSSGKWMDDMSLDNVFILYTPDGKRIFDEDVDLLAKFNNDVYGNNGKIQLSTLPPPPPPRPQQPQDKVEMVTRDDDFFKTFMECFGGVEK